MPGHTSAPSVGIDSLFPAGIAVASIGDPSDHAAADDLHPEEEPAVARAIEKRRREFALGRTCARRALRALGAPPVAIPVGANRAPAWPEGVVGSITHCAGLVAAAVGWRSEWAGVGLDAEGADPLEPRIVRMICTPPEHARLADLPELVGTSWPKLVFSAKEAVHKSVAPISGITLGFHDVELDFDAAAATFAVRYVGSGHAGLPDLTRIRGRFAVGEGVVVTTTVLPA